MAPYFYSLRRTRRGGEGGRGIATRQVQRVAQVVGCAPSAANTSGMQRAILHQHSLLGGFRV